HSAVARLVPLERVSKGYFFESDMLFNLNIIRAKVDDVPMEAVYGDQNSGLRPHREALRFLFNNLRNTGRRIFYNYFLRDFSLASVQLLLGLPLLVFGIVFGVRAWLDSAARHTDATTGTVMLAALPIILGLQLLLSFVAYDFGTVPREALHPGLGPAGLDARPPH
ncbi:MAG TPA: glycosyltransferase family 2 protein, partial [bacterium]|nr:glycosyltransferase family 2 protein [bacterium]